LDAHASAVVSIVDYRSTVATQCSYTRAVDVSIVVGVAQFDAGPLAAIYLVIGVERTVQCAKLGVLVSPVGTWAVLHTSVGDVVGVIGRRGRTLLYASVVNGVFVGLDG